MRYTLKKAGQVGGIWKLYRALRTKNACKTCALGMGGQAGGMVNERGSFPEVCKKSLQAMASDMQPAITADFWQRHSVSELQSWTPRQLETAGRLIQPVLYTRGASHWKPITWAEALDRLVGSLQSVTPNESFWYFSGRSSNEASFLLHLLARLYGTNNVNNCSYYCHQASGVGLNQVLGTGTATVTLEDIEHSDCVFVIGGNPASNHPRLMTSLTHLRRRGGKIVIINPVRELGLVKFRIPSDWRSMLFKADIATQIVQPHIGGDLALLTGIAKAIDELGATDNSFLNVHCRDSESYRAWLRETAWTELVRNSGIDEAEMRSVAETYAAAKATIFSWTMGITHHVHGVQNVHAIANLALLRGMVGRVGCGLMPIRGHSNVQGIGSMGVTPALKEQIFEKLQTEFGFVMPTTPGMDTMACMDAAYNGQAKVGVCLGGNLYGSNPDAKYAKEALCRLRHLTTLSTTLNTGHPHSLATESIILPVLARDEEPQATTQESMFNYVRLSDGGRPRLPGPRSEIEVIAELGHRLLADTRPLSWEEMRNPDQIRKWIARVIPGYAAIEEIGKSKQEFQIAGRTLHAPQFATQDGRAAMQTYAIPELAGQQERELRLMTIRSEGQFNTVVYEEEDLYRGQERRDLILMHPDDLNRLGLSPDQPVDVSSQVGRIEGYLARAYDAVRPGNALMYFPEANELVPRDLDPQSKTPAFKGVVVTVNPLNEMRRI